MSLLVRHQSVREDPKSKTIEDDLSLASSSVPIWEDEEIRSLPLSNQSYDLELCVVLYEVEVFSPRLEWHRSTRHQDMYPHWIRAHRRSIPKSSKTGSADERCPVLPRIHAHKKIDGEMWKWAPRSNWEIDRNRSRQIEIYAHSYNRIVVGLDAVDDEGWEYATKLDRFYDPKRLPQGICKFTDRVRRRRWFRSVSRVQTNNKKIMVKKKILKSSLNTQRENKRIRKDSVTFAPTYEVIYLLSSKSEFYPILSSASKFDPILEPSNKQIFLSKENVKPKDLTDVVRKPRKEILLSRTRSLTAEEFDSEILK